MRHARPAATLWTAAVLAGSLWFGTALTGSAAAVEGGKLGSPASDVVPPVELSVSVEDGRPVCAPADLRLPADTNVALQIVSTAGVPVTVTVPGQFEGGRVLHADGDLVHVASETGYLVKANGRGTLRLRTLPPGERAFSCTATDRRDAPFEGRWVLVPPAG